MMEAAVQKNECYTVEIKAMASEGNGVGKINGMTVFVPLTAPGDLALVRIVKVHRTYCYGKLEELLRPSADRVPSDCSVFSRCGGCVYRHIRYSAELAIKELTVQDAFERLGKIETQHLPIIGSKRVDEYATKRSIRWEQTRTALCARVFMRAAVTALSPVKPADCRHPNLRC